MNSLWLRLTLRLAAMVFLAFAVVRFWIDYFSSLHAEEEAITGDHVIVHTFAMGRSTLVAVFIGIVLIVLASVFPRKREKKN